MWTCVHFVVLMIQCYGDPAANEIDADKYAHIGSKWIFCHNISIFVIDSIC